MSPYDYAIEKPKLFLEENQKLFLGIRDKVKQMLKTSGAFTMSRAAHLPESVGAASSWTMMACVHRLQELGEIRQVGQEADEVFVSG